MVTDAEELNCGLALDFHFGDNADQDLRRKADLLRHLLDEPAFSTLRTREQLGCVTLPKHYQVERDVQNPQVHCSNIAMVIGWHDGLEVPYTEPEGPRVP